MDRIFCPCSLCSRPLLTPFALIVGYFLIKKCVVVQVQLATYLPTHQLLVKVIDVQKTHFAAHFYFYRCNLEHF